MDLADLGHCTLGHAGLVHLKLSGAFPGTRHLVQLVLLFFSVYVCLFKCVLHVCGCSGRPEEEASDPPEMEFLTVVSWPTSGREPN